MAGPEHAEGPDNPSGRFESELQSTKQAMEFHISNASFVELHMKNGDILNFYPLSLKVDSSLGWDMDLVVGILQDEKGAAEGWKAMPLFLIDQIVRQNID